jgi:uncharacterized protein (TIGR03435 family)
MRVLMGLVLAAGGCSAAYGQPPDAALVFEVASVKPAPPPDPRGLFVNVEGGPGTKEPERYTVENLDFAGLVMYAYDIRRDQISGPDWIRSERYNIMARVRPGATREQFRVMFQNLLAERFGLKAHWGSKEMPIYQMVIAKSGAKLKESEPEPPANADLSAGPAAAAKPVKGPAGFPALPAGGEPLMMTTSSGKGTTVALRARRETAEQIATTLSHQLGRTVRDTTGLKGRYDYTLYWAVGSGSRAAAAIPPDPSAGPAPVEEPLGPTLREAIEQQLGLKLEPARGPVEILVIDHVEQKPTEN